MPPDATLTQLAAEAYVYGFPMVFDLEQVDRFVRSGVGSLEAAPFNAFAHASTLAGPDESFVSVNNDTLYSISQLDLSGGALLFHVPAAERYKVFQFVDAWTNNFAYVGSRATGDDASDFLLTPPSWSGEVPAGATRIPVPTNVATIVGRWACDDVEDLPAVRALQAQLSLTPVGPRVATHGLAAPTPGVPDAIAFYEQLRTWMAAYPPAAADVAAQARFAPIGLLDPASPYVVPEAGLLEALTAGRAAGQAQLEAATQAGGGATASGWSAFVHIFDYNIHYLELGTIDTPEWRIEEPRRRFVTRAIAARAGLWGNHAYEAYYSQTYVDGTGGQLDGSKRYRMRFQQVPPVDAFWSVTMYATPDFYLVANPIDRYSIGDRTPGLVYEADGSLVLTLQHEPPTGSRELANWLPTPSGGFRPLIRMYRPQAAVLDGSYQLPPIESID